ncbi:Fe-S osidoreductase [Skermanella stibiiresistens SB22]|uniref:Fe-S osidoreductase n=1 Tax=Skermanella stibiiresistens SB22 TaxID=1385369 RepID=W9H2R0_9PROT|nr:radical SAM protein [Skermanella stibiiresistens]EWY40339.1 Fe-S osidoreductase [Skermanella stibiiresistens SB22]
MKVLFSNPPWWLEQVTVNTNGVSRDMCLAGIRAGSRWPHTIHTYSTPDNFVFGGYLPYPFFMGYATTFAAKATGADVVMRDSLALRESYASYFNHLREGGYRYIFIESASPSWEHDGQIIFAIKKVVPEARIVVTGPIASMGKEIMEKFPVHAVIKGEYEKGSVRVLNGEEGVIEHDLMTLEEMNNAPFPYYDEVIAHRYWDDNPRGQSAPHAHVWSSRGCPFKCIFCVWPATMTGNDPDGTAKRSVRHYTPDYMEAFLSELNGKYGYSSIYFDDDTFNIGNNHVLKMSEVMTKINLPWSAMCRADTSRMESWKIMRDAGCYGVKLGFESGNQWVVDNIVNKHLDLEYATKVVHEIKRLGMTCHGTFTYGLPGETREQMQDTKRFIASLPLDTWQESGCAAIEGTPLSNLDEEKVQKAFPGAVADDNYVVESDGAKKWRELAFSLANS